MIKKGLIDFIIGFYYDLCVFVALFYIFAKIVKKP